MTAPEKYQFETDFAHPDIVAAREAAYSEEDMASARADAFEEGRQAGKAEMVEFEERRIAELLKTLTVTVEDVTTRRSADIDAVAHETADIAQLVCRKIMPTLARQNALHEIEGLIAKTLSDMRDEPRIVVRVASGMVDPLRARVDGLSPGFAGKLVLIGDEAMDICDCEVMWADGGAERNLERLWSDIDAALTRLVEADDTNSATPVIDISEQEAKPAAEDATEAPTTEHVPSAEAETSQESD